MYDRGGKTATVQPVPDRLSDMDRTVPPAGAAERHGDIAFSLGGVAWKQQREQPFDPLGRLQIGRIFGHIGGDRRIQAGHRAQHRIPVGIAQEAHVKHQVGVAGNAAGEAERHDREGGAGIGRRESGAQFLLERVAAAVGRVDQMVGSAAQWEQQLAFAGDAVLGRAVERHRMTPARFRETADELAARAIEEENAGIVAMAAQPLDPRDDPLRVESARATVHHQGEGAVLTFVASRIGDVEQAVEEDQRQIVDHLPADVLQRADGGALARARHAGHEEQAPPLALGRHQAIARSSISTLIGADASSGATAATGTSTPASRRVWSSGSRGTGTLRSIMRATSTSGRWGISTMPTPRTSILPTMWGGGDAWRRPSRRRTWL